MKTAEQRTSGCESASDGCWSEEHVTYARSADIFFLAEVNKDGNSKEEKGKHSRKIHVLLNYFSSLLSPLYICMHTQAHQRVKCQTFPVGVSTAGRMLLF